MDNSTKYRIKTAIKETVQEQIEANFAEALISAIKCYDFSEAIQSNFNYVLDDKLGDYLDSYVEEAVCDALETTLENIFE